MLKVSNHPVHIVNGNEEWNPSALIPFCEFGGNMSVMGVKIDKFDVPVCNSFKAKIFKDQLCYSVDPNIYRDFINSNRLSLILVIDFNEDRQFLQAKEEEKPANKKESFEGNDDKLSHYITVETIGKL